MKLMTIAALAMLMATSALAFLDPTPDTIGIYLDTGAEEVCVDGLVDGGTNFTFYMIITNPSFDTMEGFLAGYSFDGIAGVNSAVLAQADATENGYLGDHIVNYSSPVPTSDNTLLMTLSATFHDYEYGSARLKLHGIQFADKNGIVPGAMTGGDIVDLHLTYEDGTTIRINEDCGSVATDRLSFDGIKSLYR